MTVEDRREIRDGLAMLIDSTSDFRCIGKFRSMEEALPAIDHRVPDLVLADIGLPGMSGIEGMRIIREKHPRVRGDLCHALSVLHAVSFHMRRIYEKLQVHSKSEAVAKALKNRLVS